jgi:alpha-D-xyloside xylohydrolase
MAFPEFSTFPSGADGEQMHSLFGLRFQDTIQTIFDRRKQSTYGLVRSSQALSAPCPYVLYSDLYDHRQFIRGLVNSGCRSRIANNASQFTAGWECRSQVPRHHGTADAPRALSARRLRPYRREGLPPCRALVLDYPKDAKTWTVEDQYMMGDSLMAAPVVAGQTRRSIYLPEGEWVDFWTGTRHPETAPHAADRQTFDWPFTSTLNNPSRRELAQKASCYNDV